MATLAKDLYTNTLTTTSTTLYTVPASTTTIVKEITIANSTSSDATVTLSISGSVYLGSVKVYANSTVSMPGLSKVMGAAKTITGNASVASALTIHISGIEVS